MEEDEDAARVVKSSGKSQTEYLLERDCMCASAAIEYYNKKHGTDYEVVETRGSSRTLIIGFWYHCNFIAQRNKEMLKLFFAELNKTSKLTCKTCQLFSYLAYLAVLLLSLLLLAYLSVMVVDMLFFLGLSCFSIL